MTDTRPHKSPRIHAALALATASLALGTSANADPYCDGLWQARNAVFARNGHCFKNPEAQALFGKGCFAPYGKLGPTDQAIVNTLLALERDANCTKSTPAGNSASSGAPTIPKYTVTVSLSPAAKKKLAGSGETFTVGAYYFGEPKPGVKAEDSGEISLGSERKDIETGNSITLGGIAYPKAQVAKIIGENPQILINVFTSRKVFPGNILDCGIWQDDAAKAVNLPISCKLIDEP